MLYHCFASFNISGTSEDTHLKLCTWIEGKRPYTKQKNAKLVNTGRGLDHVTFDFDFQHGYQMWTWFVNFLDQEKTKINFKN